MCNRVAPFRFSPQPQNSCTLLLDHSLCTWYMEDPRTILVEKPHESVQYSGENCRSRGG